MADDQAAVQAAPPGRFTARELAAAEQLIHLSESSCSASYLPRGGGGSGVASASSTSSPRSVNAPPLAPAPAPPPPAGLLAPGGGVVAEDDEDEEEDQQEVGGRRRKNKRYRLIAEIYRATEPRPIGAAAPRRRKADRPSTDAAGK